MPNYNGPSPDFETDNYPGDFTVINTTTFPANAHGGKSAQSDGVTGNLTRTGVITAADGQEHTLAFWGQSPDLTSASGDEPTFMAQRQQNGQARFSALLMVGGSAGKIQVRFQRWSNVNELFFQSTGRFDDGIRHQFVVVCQSALQSAPETLQDAIRVYTGKNGARVAGTVSIVGAGDQGGEGLAPLTILSTNNGSVISNAGFITSRPRIWRTKAFTDQEAADYSLDEFEGIGASGRIIPKIAGNITDGGIAGQILS